MHYFTKTGYHVLTGISRPTIDRMIERGELHTINTEEGARIIMVEDTEYGKIKSKESNAIYKS